MSDKSTHVWQVSFHHYHCITKDFFVLPFWQKMQNLGWAKEQVIGQPFASVPPWQIPHFVYTPSLQIFFFYKPVVCQARDKVLADIQSVWSDKNIFPHLLKKKIERMTCFCVIKLFQESKAPRKSLEVEIICTANMPHVLHSSTPLVQ